MNVLAMVVDVPHAPLRTAMDAIKAYHSPVTFSLDGSYTLASNSLQSRRLTKDDELPPCAWKCVVTGITAVPDRLSNELAQSIECVLDHYDYMMNLVDMDHMAIGTDTSIGDMVEISRVMLGRTGPAPAPLPERPGVAGTTA